MLLLAFQGFPVLFSGFLSAVFMFYKVNNNVQFMPESLIEEK